MFQNGLVSFYFPRAKVMGVRMQRSQKRSSSGQIALGLRDTGLDHRGVNVVRCKIENLIKFSQRFGETTYNDQGKGVLSKQVNIAWVEPLSFVEVGVAPVPVASGSLDISEGLKN